MRHNVCMRCFLLALLIATYSLPASAWNAAGHRIVALIAWHQTCPQTQATVSQLLALHPDYPRWAEHGDHSLSIFLEASTWPDDIRNDPRFDDEGSLPPAPGFADSHRHRQWHYSDYSDDNATRSSHGELELQLDRLSRLIADPKTSPQTKAYALPWLIHLLADSHQPLHVGRHADEGGNRFRIEDPENPRLPESNLHRWWDDRPGPPWLRGKYLERRVGALLERYPEVPPQGNIRLWLEESRELTRTRAYPATNRITPEFHQQAQAVAERRLVEAGWRLGRWLEQLVQPVSRETSSE